LYQVTLIRVDVSYRFSIKKQCRQIAPAGFKVILNFKMRERFIGKECIINHYPSKIKKMECLNFIY